MRLKGKGQVTLPASVREHLTLREGDMLRVTVQGRRIVLEPAAQTRAVAIPLDVHRLDGLVGAFPLGGDAVADAARYDD
ncbi:MAG: AbrB/MazE/SpoVT family DNA-binding domain-containing protein [Armatimonadota bacterium]